MRARLASSRHAAASRMAGRHEAGGRVATGNRRAPTSRCVGTTTCCIMMELLSVETLGYLLAAKLAWSLLVFLKNMLTSFGLCGGVNPKSLGDWAVGASR